MGISRWPYRRLEALKQELHDIEERIKNVNIQSIKPTYSTSTQFSSSPISSSQHQHQHQHQQLSLQLEESILKGSIELIHHIPNIIVKHSNEHIKEIARKTQRISLSNLLNL